MDTAPTPIRHVPGILSPSLDRWGEVIMGMFTGAFDDGGTKDTPVLTVAGFVSSAKDWDDFSRLWTERLNKEGIKYFRAAEAAHFTKQFKPWRDWPKDKQEAWRRNLFQDLMKILKSHVYRKFGCTIINKYFNTLSEENKKFYRLNAYSWAGRTCDKYVREWARNEHITSPVQLVFEAGSEGTGELINRLFVDTKRKPIFRPKKDTVMDDGSVEHGFVPLQAGDWLAYELSDAVEKQEAGTLKEFRWPLEQFERILGEPTVYTESDIKESESLLNLNTQLIKWDAKIKKRSA
jgi:hypothetical protein